MDLSTWQGMRSRDPRRLTLGSAQWGMPYGIANRTGVPDESELEAMLRRADAVGIRSIDTARAYGRSEERIGSLIDRLEGWRVVTKLAPDAHREGLGIAEALERVGASLAESRRALDRDSLTTVLLHRFSHRHACGGKLWRMLLAERDAGRIGSLGVSAATPEEAWAALEDPDIEVLQVASSLLDLRLYRQGFFPRAREMGRTVYVRSAFLQGVALLEPFALPGFLAAAREPMQTIEIAANRIGVPVRAVYLAFVRELPGAHPVLGCETDAQLEELLADWTSEAVDAAALCPLIEALPTLEAEVVDPSRWPQPEPAATRDVAQRLNQTSPASVAKIPD